MQQKSAALIRRAMAGHPRAYTEIGLLKGLLFAGVIACRFIMSGAWVRDARRAAALDHERLEVCLDGWEVTQQVARMSADVSRACMAEISRADTACACWLPEGSGQ